MLEIHQVMRLLIFYPCYILSKHLGFEFKLTSLYCYTEVKFTKIEITIEKYLKKHILANFQPKNKYNIPKEFSQPVQQDYDMLILISYKYLLHKSEKGNFLWENHILHVALFKIQ